MSHEGIRIVSREEAQEFDRQYRDPSHGPTRELPREATEPAKVRVLKTEGTGMEIDWKDGHRSAWNFRWLRDACPCATCVEEREKDGREPGEPKRPPASPLPLYRDPPRPATVTPTGRYAISFGWNDGHASGIYSWDFLRRHCVCAKCRSGPS